VNEYRDELTVAARKERAKILEVYFVTMQSAELTSEQRAELLRGTVKDFMAVGGAMQVLGTAFEDVKNGKA
jgi:hypothetical protein